MATRHTVLIPLVDKTGTHQHMLEVTFRRRLRLNVFAPLSAAETLARAGIDFAPQCAAQASRMAGSGWHDVTAEIARPTANIVAEGAWLGIILGMVLALEDRGPTFLAAIGQLVGDDDRLDGVDPAFLSRRLMLVADLLERQPGEMLPVVVPAMTHDGIPVRLACADAVARLQDCGGRLLMVENLDGARADILRW